LLAGLKTTPNAKASSACITYHLILKSQNNVASILLNACCSRLQVCESLLPPHPNPLPLGEGIIRKRIHGCLLLMRSLMKQHRSALMLECDRYRDENVFPSASNPHASLRGLIMLTLLSIYYR